MYTATYSYFYNPDTVNNGYSNAKISFWTGLGGDGNDALIQTGVVADYNRSYWAWIEYFNYNDINITADYDFAVNYNDEMLVECWVSDANGTMDFLGGHGAYWLEDVTTGTAWPNQGQVAVLSAPNNDFDGSTAEWIAERENLGTDPVANFGTSYFTGEAEDENTNYHNAYTDAYIIDDITSDGTSSGKYLVTATTTNVPWVYGVQYQAAQ